MAGGTSMNLARLSVPRPVFTSMVVLIVVILGVVSLQRLPVDLMPDITYPRLNILTTYGNASPLEMEELVTRPIEQAMSAVPGVVEVSSSSSEGRSNVGVLFTWGTDLDVASNDVRDRLDRIIGRLPDDADRPVLRKFDPAAFPIMFLGASSNLDPLELRRLIDDQVKYRIERVPGVAALDVWGGLSREIHVEIDPDKVKALGLSLDQVLDRIRAANVNVPAGTINRGNYEVTIRTPGEFTSLAELRETVIAVQGGASIPLREVAKVTDSWEDVRQIVRLNGQPGVRLAVNKQSGQNTVQVARAVLDEVASINEQIPQLRLTPLMNSATFIERSISAVSNATLGGGLLAIFVLLFFLREVRSTAIIATAIPVSIIATFVLMYFGGFTLNIMTLGALALGVGMLVDNSIVVLENIFRLREGGRDPQTAALQGTQEVSAAILASTLTTVVVFLPLIFVRGMAGVMFKQFSLVITYALFCSLAVAMTLVPMLAAKVLKPRRSHPAGRRGFGRHLFNLSGRLFTWLENGYKDLLHTALNHRAVVAVLVLVVLGSTLLLVPLVGSEFMPTADEGEVRVSVEMEIGTRLDLTDQRFLQVERIVRESVPEAENIIANIGGGGSHAGMIRIALKPKRERQRSDEQVSNDLRRLLSGLPGMTIRTRRAEGLFMPGMGGMTGADRLQVEIRGHDFETAEALARRVKAVVEAVPGVTDARTSRDAGAPEELIVIDRRKAEDLNLRVSQVANMLQTTLSGTRASNFREAGDEFRILVRLEDAAQKQLRDLLDLTVTNSLGQPVVLRNVVDVQPRLGPVRIDRKNQERLLTVSANKTADRDMGSILDDIRRGLADVPVPRGFAISFGGDYEEQQKSFRELLLGLILALVLVYMVMACQYESLRDPFVVMFSVPLAAIGVILMLFLTSTSFSVQAFIGCIMLGGIVVNNAILLVDHTNLLRRRDGMPLRAAIEEAGRRRLRPILMTASTTMLGLVPLALAIGEGSEAQAPLARTVIGGLLSATLITLVVVPVVYSIFERKGWKHGHERKEQEAIVPEVIIEDRNLKSQI
jgi:HAE1 family hydrophobic/amphiphilic exporter-1